MPTGVYKRIGFHKLRLKVPRIGSGIYVRTKLYRQAMSKSLKGKEKSELHSKHISEAKMGAKNPMFNKDFSKEHRRKIGEANKGKNAWNYVEDRRLLQRYGKDNLDRRGSAYRDWRKQIWVRDNYECKIFNKDCCGRIEVHHILSYTDYPELRYQPNNGITLCHAHHPRKRAEEKRLIPTFQELVTVSKVTF